MARTRCRATTKPPKFPPRAIFPPGLMGSFGGMLLSILAILILLGSTLLILGNLRLVMRDIYDVMVSTVSGMRFTDHLAANLALVALWVVLFVLSYE